MKKLMMLILSGVSVIVLSGCGGGGGTDEYSAIPVTYYLQTYDSFDDVYRGVPGVEYDCGPDSGVTDQSGAFHLYEGDVCTFYGLDDTLSFSFVDELYMDSGLISIDYTCDSDPFYTYQTDVDGMFIFDPYYLPADPSLPVGDICEFQF